MASDDQAPKGPVRKIGLKKTNDVVQSPIPTAKDFENVAEAQFLKIEDYKNQMRDFGSKFKSAIESDILPVNRGPIASNLEKEVIEGLVKLATSMNEDDTQDEGIGSTALCMLLMKSVFIQRDKINILSHKVSILENLCKKNVT